MLEPWASTYPTVVYFGSTVPITGRFEGQRLFGTLRFKVCLNPHLKCVHGLFPPAPFPVPRRRLLGRGSLAQTPRVLSTYMGYTYILTRDVGIIPYVETLLATMLVWILREIFGTGTKERLGSDLNAAAAAS